MITTEPRLMSNPTTKIPRRAREGGAVADFGTGTDSALITFADESPSERAGAAATGTILRVTGVPSRSVGPFTPALPSSCDRNNWHLLAAAGPVCCVKTCGAR